MKALFKPKVFKQLILFLLLLMGIKFLWFMLELTQLPSVGVDHVSPHVSKALFYRVKLTPNQAPVPVKKVVPIVKKPLSSIKDITLLAIYNATDMVVVTVEYKDKSKVLSKGDAINGFVLEGAQSTFAIFSKDTRTYKVQLFKSKVDPQSAGSIIESKKLETSFSKRAIRLKQLDKTIDNLRNNIAIVEFKDRKNAKGFKITYVRKGSLFAQKGMKKGDVIKAINGQEINSYNTVFTLYENMQNVENVTLSIQRGKEHMEFRL